MPLRRLQHSAALFCLFALLLQACSTPAGRIREQAARYQFSGKVVRADGFDHQVFLHRTDLLGSTGVPRTLRVYLEGDGQPWRHRSIIMPDPTPRRALMLELMHVDHGPAAYVGRPCYYGFSREPGCEHPLWTSARYSARVIASMAEVIRVLQERLNVDDLWLIGHSGGGALAMLLAERLDAVSHVITLAGNLDTRAWTEHHRYSPLFASLNPARRPPLGAEIQQWHLLGSADRNVPPALVAGAIERQPKALAIELAGFTHSCCWASIWPGLLDSVAAGAPEQVPGVILQGGPERP